jgi:formylglycine-generating enzyme required for sulfatase activity
MKSGGSARRVMLDDFLMSATEVTFDQFDAYCKATGARKPDDKGWGRGSRPVLNVSWEEATGFCRWLSGKSGAEIRLPNEAEWEYAAVGGKKSEGHRYSGSDNWQEVSWSEENSGGTTHPVGQKKPNELGLYDMSGNLWEMCEDWPAADPGQPRFKGENHDEGAAHALHGNSYDNPASDPRNADVHASFGNGHTNIGFRVVKMKQLQDAHR